MSLTHYSNEIIKIGLKFQLPSSIIGIIYNYNKGNYLNHFEILVGSVDNSFYMNLKYCYLNDYYYNKELCLYCDTNGKDIPTKPLERSNHNTCNNHAEFIVNSFDKLFYMNIKYCDLNDYYYNRELCLYCDICIVCDKPSVLSNHYCCPICVKTHKTKQFHCYYCNKCENIEHRYCIECASCVPIEHDKFCTSELINSKDDAIYQIKHYLSQITDIQSAILKKPVALKLIRISVQFIQTYTHNDFTYALYNKILEFMDNEYMNMDEILKLNKYKLIVQKYMVENNL